MGLGPGRPCDKIWRVEDNLDRYGEIAYRESERMIATQLQSFDELRSRTGLLLAATAVTASFLGAAALDREGGLGYVGILALIAFGIGVGACLYVLWPQRDAYKFVLSPMILLDSWSDGR